MRLMEKNSYDYVIGLSNIIIDINYSLRTYFTYQVYKNVIFKNAPWKIMNIIRKKKTTEEKSVRLLVLFKMRRILCGH